MSNGKDSILYLRRIDKGVSGIVKFCSSPATEPEEEADGGVVERHGGKIARPEGRHLGLVNLVGSGEVDDEGETKENERGECRPDGAASVARRRAQGQRRRLHERCPQSG